MQVTKQFCGFEHDLVALCVRTFDLEKYHLLQYRALRKRKVNFAIKIEINVRCETVFLLQKRKLNLLCIDFTTTLTKEDIF